jgi:hypothetical protein
MFDMDIYLFVPVQYGISVQNSTVPQIDSERLTDGEYLSISPIGIFPSVGSVAQSFFVPMEEGNESMQPCHTWTVGQSGGNKDSTVKTKGDQI